MDSRSRRSWISPEEDVTREVVSPREAGIPRCLTSMTDGVLGRWIPYGVLAGTSGRAGVHPAERKVRPEGGVVEVALFSTPPTNSAGATGEGFPDHDVGPSHGRREPPVVVRELLPCASAARPGSSCRLRTSVFWFDVILSVVRPVVPNHRFPSSSDRYEDDAARPRTSVPFRHVRPRADCDDRRPSRDVRRPDVMDRRF